jgi:hypothetical protein
MSRADPEQAAMVKAYASYFNRPIRTATHHRKHNHPDWVAFVASYSVSTAPQAAPLRVAASPSICHGERTLPSDLDRARIAETEAWASLQACIAHKQAAIAKKNPVLVAGWIKAEAEAAKTHRDASKHRLQVEQQSGKLIPISEIDKIRTDFIEPIREILRTAPQEIGPEANPMYPEQGIRAVSEWRERRLNRALNSLANSLPTPLSPSTPTGSMEGKSSTGTGEQAAP